jgi:hypothetical protein
MRSRLLAVSVLTSGVLGLLPGPAAGQAFDSLGSWALGMAGAFVAVADDPSAAWWNPAGLASGQPGSVTLEWLGVGRSDLDQAAMPGHWRRTSRFASLGTWPVGLSVVDIDESRIATHLSGARATRLSTRHYAASVLQTVADGVVVGTTLRYVRGTAASHEISGSTETADAVFEVLARGPAPSRGAVDLDLATMVDLGRVRLGGTVRNLRTPTFTDVAGIAITVPRESRVGVSAMPSDGLTFALDLDVAPVERASGRSQVVALGVERRVTTRATARAGVRRNLVGDEAWVAAAGVSVAVRRGAWLDGHATWGHSPSERGFGVAVRAGW